MTETSLSHYSGKNYGIIITSFDSQVANLNFTDFNKGAHAAMLYSTSGNIQNSIFQKTKTKSVFLRVSSRNDFIINDVCFYNDTVENESRSILGSTIHLSLSNCTFIDVLANTISTSNTMKFINCSTNIKYADLNNFTGIVYDKDVVNHIIPIFDGNCDPNMFMSSQKEFPKWIIPVAVTGTAVILIIVISLIVWKVKSKKSLEISSIDNTNNNELLLTLYQN